MTASQAMEVFENTKIRNHLKVMEQVGLSYLTLGQPLNTLSGGEVVFTGTPADMALNAKTLTADSLRASLNEK